MSLPHDLDDFSRGRKFGAEDLNLMLTALLADAPSHGYELIKMLDTRSNGFYRPSPGMVYPALTYLEEIGYAGISVAGNRKCYTLTDEGRAFLDANRERVEMLWAKLNFLGKKMNLVRRALADGGDAGTLVISHDEAQGGIVNRSQVLRLLTQNKAVLADRFGLVSLALFGSTARDAAGPQSDIDILVSFDGPATSDRYFGVQFFLEDLLGRPVDLVTEKALRPEIRPFIELEAVHV
jgi:predicted nucleotidyltransferase/DNA-binding PadR family transcriptional regulator